MNFGPLRWSALNMGVVDKQPPRMQRRLFWRLGWACNTCWWGCQVERTCRPWPWNPLPPMMGSRLGRLKPAQICVTETLWMPPLWWRARKISTIDRDRRGLKAFMLPQAYGFSSPSVELKKLHVGWNLHLHPLMNVGWKFSKSILH